MPVMLAEGKPRSCSTCASCQEAAVFLLFLLFLQEIINDERFWAAGILERGQRDQPKNSEATSDPL
jgi:hypothetical protein